MYSNFNFQILQKPGSFLSYHNGIANSSKAPLYPALGAVSPIIARVGGGFPQRFPPPHTL